MYIMIDRFEAAVFNTNYLREEFLIECRFFKHLLSLKETLEKIACKLLK
jgi:hypothetical protein